MNLLIVINRKLGIYYSCDFPFPNPGGGVPVLGDHVRASPQEVDTGVNTHKHTHVDEPPGMVGISRFRGIVVARQGWGMVITLKLPVEICSLSGRSEIFPHGGPVREDLVGFEGGNGGLRARGLWL